MTMRVTHQRIIDAWLAGRAAYNHGASRDGNGRILRFWTDGAVLYSYAMPIARRLRVPPTATVRYELVERGRCPSATTRAHLDAARTACSRWDGERWHREAIRWVQAVHVPSVRAPRARVERGRCLSFDRHGAGQVRCAKPAGHAGLHAADASPDVVCKKWDDATEAKPFQY